MRDLSDDGIGVRQRNSSNALLKPGCPFHLDALFVCMPSHISQQVAPARTLGTFKVDACRVTETCIQDPHSVITIFSPDTASLYRFTLRISGNPISSARG